MKAQSTTPKNIDEYIASCVPEVQDILQKVRATISQAAPDAEEKISYAMPCFAQQGNLVYFAAAKNHLGFYPTLSGVREFQSELSAYKTSKGAIQFPLGAPIPVALIRKIVQFRVAENLAKAVVKKKS